MIQPSLEFVVGGFKRWNQCKLFLQAKYVILCRALSEKIHAEGAQLKKLENQAFWFKSQMFEPKCWILAFFSSTPVACALSERARYNITYSACSQSFALVPSPKPSNYKFQRRLDHKYLSTEIFLRNRENRVLRIKSLFKTPIIGF